MTGVLRAYRGRGIAAALKRTQIRWAKEAGYEKLQTANEVRNEPIRKLNARHGYRLEPGLVTLETALAAPE
jgi:GNAT superfamily N-acetyltransferase